MTRLCIDAGSPEPSLLADGISTQILCAGAFIQLNIYSARNLGTCL